MLQIQFSGINLYSLLFFLVCVAACVALAWYLYGKSMPPVYPTPRPETIGGGLIFVMLFLGLRIIVYTREILKSEIWMENYWGLMEENLAAMGNMRVPIYAAVILTVMLLAMAITGVIFLTFLFFKKRDIFPRLLTVIFITIEGVSIAIILISSLWTDVEEVIASTGYGTLAIGWLVIGFCIWYVNYAERAKRTFVLPHPSLENYDDPEFLNELTEENQMN